MTDEQHHDEAEAPTEQVAAAPPTTPATEPRQPTNARIGQLSGATRIGIVALIFAAAAGSFALGRTTADEGPDFDHPMIGGAGPGFGAPGFAGPGGMPGQGGFMPGAGAIPGGVMPGEGGFQAPVPGEQLPPGTGYLPPDGDGEEYPDDDAGETEDGPDDEASEQSENEAA